MRLRKKLLASYLALYAVGHFAAVYDGRQQVENRENLVVVQEFSLPIASSDVFLTLVGERHVYSKYESDLSAKMLQGQELVLMEGNGPDVNLSASELLMVGSLVIPLSYGVMGRGLSFDVPTIEEHAKKNHLKIDYIEEKTGGGVNTFTPMQKMTTTVIGAGFTLLGPVSYFLSAYSREAPKTTEEAIGGYDSQGLWMTLFNADGRNTLMMGEAIEDLQRAQVGRAMMVVGRGHFRGMREGLLQRGAKPISKAMYLDEYVNRK